MDNIYEKNLKCIEKKNRKLYATLCECADAVELEKTRSGEYTFRYKNRYFHSRYDPWKEARQQLEEVLSKKHDILCLFGMGCGYLLRLIMEKPPSKVIVYEPDVTILKGVLKKIDLSSVLTSKNIFIYSDIDDLASHIAKGTEGTEDILSYQPPVYIQCFPDKLVEYINKIRNAQITNICEIQTDILSRLDWIENYLTNIPNLIKYPVIDKLLGRFKGVPLIIVGAGPSLRKNIHLLKDIKGKALIIAAITAHRILLTHGIVPDFVIAAEKIDMSEYFTNTDEEKMVRLMLPELVHPSTFEKNTRGKFVYFSSFLELGKTHAKYWGSEFLPDVGGSVTTAALSMGVAFGCNPIVFIGQDLSFSPEGLSHAPGGVYSEQELKIDEKEGKAVVSNRYISIKEKIPQELQLLWLKGVDGKPVPSKSAWVTFHQWFEDYMRYLSHIKPDLKVINATEGGAYINGMDHIPLKEVIDKYITKDAGIEEKIEQAESEPPARDLQGLMKSFQKMHKSLKDISRLARKIICEAKHVKERSEASGISVSFKDNIKKLKQLESKLFKRSEDAKFIWEALVSYTYKLKEELKEEEEDLRKEFIKNLDTVIGSYERVDKMAKRFIPSLERSAGYIKELMNRERSEHHA